jgi:hypothetical protein
MRILSLNKMEKYHISSNKNNQIEILSGCKTQQLIGASFSFLFFCILIFFFDIILIIS